MDPKEAKDICLFLQEAKPSKSKWASPEKVGQEVLYEACEKVLAELKAYVPYSVPFLTKVNKREVPDYFDVIKNPMDLGTVGKKLKAFVYNSKQDFLDDLQLIWSNCFKYNVIEGNVYVLYAQQMKARTEALSSKIPDLNVHNKDEAFESDLNVSMSSLPSTELPPPSPLEPEEIPFVHDENDHVNSFRENFIEKRYFHMQMRKKLIQNNFPLLRDSCRMGDFLSQNANADFFPELDYFVDSFPLLPQHNFAEMETSVSLHQVPGMRPHARALDELVETINQLNNIRNLKRNSENIKDTQINQKIEASPIKLAYLNPTKGTKEIGSFNTRAAKVAILPLLALFLESFGFESAQQSAFSLFTDVFLNFLGQIGKTLRLFKDSFCKETEDVIIYV